HLRRRQSRPGARRFSSAGAAGTPRVACSSGARRRCGSQHPPARHLRGHVMMGVRLMVIDVDGTLLTPDKVLTERAARAVRELRPQTLLAYEMNGAPLPIPHGAPCRL